jgi:hypothetical protein
LGVRVIRAIPDHFEYKNAGKAFMLTRDYSRQVSPARVPSCLFQTKKAKSDGSAGFDASHNALCENRLSSVAAEALRDYQRLMERPPPRFDRLYVYMMFKWHAVALRGYQQAVKIVTEPKLQAWTEQTLPIIEDHLESIRRIAIAKAVPMNSGESQRTIPKY